MMMKRIIRRFPFFSIFHTAYHLPPTLTLVFWREPLGAYAYLVKKSTAKWSAQGRFVDTE